MSVLILHKQYKRNSGHFLNCSTNILSHVDQMKVVGCHVFISKIIFMVLILFVPVQCMFGLAVLISGFVCVCCKLLLMYMSRRSLPMSPSRCWYIKLVLNSMCYLEMKDYCIIRAGWQWTTKWKLVKFVDTCVNFWGLFSVWTLSYFALLLFRFRSLYF